MLPQSMLRILSVWSYQSPYWCEWWDSNPHAEAKDFKSFVYADSTTLAISGDPPGSRTPANGFGDRCATVTLEGHVVTYALLRMRVIKHTGSQCVLLRYLFTTCVIAAGFSSGSTPSLVAGCFECPAGSRCLLHFQQKTQGV